MTYCHDGMMNLWALMNNIHRSNIDFIEYYIQEKISSVTLAHYQNNIEKYLTFVKNNPCMNMPKSSALNIHQGLLTFIFRQLQRTTDPLLFCHVQDLHIQYHEAKLPKYSPQKLVLNMED